MKGTNLAVAVLVQRLCAVSEGTEGAPSENPLAVREVEWQVLTVMPCLVLLIVYQKTEMISSTARLLNISEDSQLRRE